MKEDNLDSFCFNCFLLISLVVCVSNAHEFQCPSSNQWLFRAKSRCLITEGYICLLDENRKKFTEICRNGTYSDRAGYKIVIAGNLDQRKCESTRYQPFRFSTYGRSTCVLEKTYCSEEGQIVFDNGSTESDRQCRCDYTRGYDFITKPKHMHGCYCIPSMEDCSCYQKPCPQGFILSPDYQCINLANWDAQFTCELIVPYQSTNTNFSIDDTDTDESKSGPVINMRIVIIILIGVTLIVALIMALITKSCLPKIESLKEQNTELKSLLTATDIPQRIRDAQTNLKGLWRNMFSHFVETRAFKAILKIIQQEQCIIISGSMGCGKSSTAFHIAMAFEETTEVDVTVMIISNPDDIFKYAIEDKMQLFLIDDVFGKYSVSDYNSMWWNHNAKFVQNILERNSNLKLIMTSRLHILHSVNPKLPTFCHLNLISEDLALTFEERKKIGRRYLQDDIIDNIGEEVIMSASFFPALCANVPAKNKENIIDYFTLPVDYISSETINMRTSGDLFYLSLTILIIFDNKVKKDLFNEGNHQYDEMLQFLSKEIGFNRQPLKSLLFSRYIAMKESYVLEKKEYFECLHEILFNSLVLSIGSCIVRTLIVYGESSFLNKRTCPETSGGDYPKLTIVIPRELQDMYFDRILSDIKLGKYDLYKGHQHSTVEFRKSCITYLKRYLKEGDFKIESHKTTVLHVVSIEGFADYVEFFLGLDKTLVDLQDDHGQTALHKACMHGHINVAKILLDNGACIDMADNNNQTALYIACEKSQSRTVCYLLSRGSSIQHKKGDSKIPLHVVCLHGNTEIAKSLLEKKAKVNAQDTKSYTPLHLACTNRHTDVVKLLVQYKPDINLVDNELKTAMYIAAEQGDINIVRCLLELSPKLDIATDKGRVPLHCASEHGSEEIANLLIEHKADVNIDDTAGCTPLYIACKNGHLKIVELLLHNNANVHIRNALRNTPLLIACEKGNTEIVQLLLKNQADANCKNNEEMTPLYKACTNDQTDIVSLLIEHGALVNEPNENLQTPLFRACLKGNYNVADELLKRGASVNQANINGLTPLHAACIKERKDIVMLLLNSDADIKKEDKKGVTPLGIACSSGNKCIEHALLLKLHNTQNHT